MDDYLPLSALQHYAYCPRQFALIHLEQAWVENHFTMEGKILHERVDSGLTEQRGTVRKERSVSVVSHQYRIIGKMDLLEIETIHDQVRLFPVEYKRGKPKTESWDHVQLCAQALCLEEMRSVDIEEGAVWYWQIRQRERVIIDNLLRQTTIQLIEEAHELLRMGKTPAPIEQKSRCRGCSLKEICQPDTWRSDHSVSYVRDLFFLTPPEQGDC